jgi:hypothetical protein
VVSPPRRLELGSWDRIPPGNICKNKNFPTFFRILRCAAASRLTPSPSATAASPRPRSTTRSGKRLSWLVLHKMQKCSITERLILGHALTFGNGVLYRDKKILIIFFCPSDGWHYASSVHLQLQHLECCKLEFFFQNQKQIH